MSKYFTGRVASDKKLGGFVVLSSCFAARFPITNSSSLELCPPSKSPMFPEF